MRKLLPIVLILCGLFAFSKNRTNTRSSYKALQIYTQNHHGFYILTEDSSLSVLPADARPYALNVKNKILYLETDYSNIEASLSDSAFKIAKKLKDIYKFKNPDEVKPLSFRITSNLETCFQAKNHIRQQEIQDSIERVKADSLRRIQQELEIKLAKQREAEAYRTSHEYFHPPLFLKEYSAKCLDCEKSFYTDDLKNLLLTGVKNDTLVFLHPENFNLGHTLVQMHLLRKSDFKAKSPFEGDSLLYHINVFRDSLENYEDVDLKTMPPYFNSTRIESLIEQVKKEAPYGFIDDWHWNSDYGMVSMDLSYININKKTIKYLTVYFTIKNDVNDVRCRGYLKGTGPVAQYETGEWDWDYTSYFVSGDASNMFITKIILTYMDGTQKVLTGNQIVFNE